LVVSASCLAWVSLWVSQISCKYKDLAPFGLAGYEFTNSKWTENV